MTSSSDPAELPNTEAAGEAAAEAVGTRSASAQSRHMLNKIDALEAAIVELHDVEHNEPIQWCSHPLCRTLDDWR